MTVLYIILLAIVQGITEFLPVSSFGHLCFLQNFLGMEHGSGVLLETMLHLGTLAAIFMTFQKDIRHLAFGHVYGSDRKCKSVHTQQKDRRSASLYTHYQ